MRESYNAAMSDPDQLRSAYALIWRSSEPDETFDHSEFDQRIPRLMEWLSKLRADGKLLACGGGGFATHSGGLTVIAADDVEQALEIADGHPMNEIGTTELMVWDVYFADLVEPRDF